MLPAAEIVSLRSLSFIAVVRTSAIKHTIKQFYVLLYVLLHLCELH